MSYIYRKPLYTFFDCPYCGQQAYYSRNTTGTGAWDCHYCGGWGVLSQEDCDIMEFVHPEIPKFSGEFSCYADNVQQRFERLNRVIHDNMPPEDTDLPTITPPPFWRPDSMRAEIHRKKTGAYGPPDPIRKYEIKSNGSVRMSPPVLCKPEPLLMPDGTYFVFDPPKRARDYYAARGVKPQPTTPSEGTDLPPITPPPFWRPDSIRAEIHRKKTGAYGPPDPIRPYDVKDNGYVYTAPPVMCKPEPILRPDGTYFVYEVPKK